MGCPDVSSPAPSPHFGRRSRPPLYSTGVLYLVLTFLFLWELVATPAGLPRLVPMLETLTGPICHHLPERTLTVFDTPLPVCARCSGIWLGWIAVSPLGFLFEKRHRSCSCLRALRPGLLVCATYCAAAALSEHLQWVALSNLERLLLGLPLGIAAGLALISASRSLEEVGA